MKTERTSPRVAKIAAKVMAMPTRTPPKDLGIMSAGKLVVTWADIRAMAASCLTQSADRADASPSNLPARKQTASGMPRGGTKPANATSGQIRGSNPVERIGPKRRKA